MPAIPVDWHGDCPASNLLRDAPGKRESGRATGREAVRQDEMLDADGTEKSEIPFVGPHGRHRRDENPHLRLAHERSDEDTLLPGAGMDIPREPRGPGGRIAVGLAILVLLAAVTVVLARLRPAPPAVDGDLIVTAVVQKGMLPIEVRGWGELAADQVQRVEATVAGRVASIQARPGDVVQAGSPLVQLANPDLALETARAEQEFTAAKAAFTALRRSIGTQRLEREASLVERRADLARASRAAERVEALFARNEASQSELAAAVETVEVISEQVRVEEEMLALLKETGDEQISLEKEKLIDLAEVLQREKERLSALTVVAPGDAVVESVDVAGGAWVDPGTRLVRLIRPERLRADLKVPLPAAKKVLIGSAVLLVDAVGDTTGGEVQLIGVPESGEGGKYVHVSVRLEDPPRADAAVDAGVDAVIDLGSIEDALYVKRPAWAGDDGVSSVFRVSADGKSAERVKVQFGAGSSDRVQVLGGLQQGDVIIVSDMSGFDSAERVRIK